MPTVDLGSGNIGLHYVVVGEMSQSTAAAEDFANTSEPRGIELCRREQRRSPRRERWSHLPHGAANRPAWDCWCVRPPDRDQFLVLLLSDRDQLVALLLSDRDQLVNVDELAEWPGRRPRELRTRVCCTVRGPGPRRRRVLRILCRMTGSRRGTGARRFGQHGCGSAWMHSSFVSCWPRGAYPRCALSIEAARLHG